MRGWNETRIGCALGAVLVCASALRAATPPSNDLCVDAIHVGDVINLPFSTRLATHDPSGNCGITSPNIWFCYEASFTGVATVSLCGSDYDTYLGVYEGCACDPVGTTLCCNDDFCNLQSQCDVPVIEGNHYLIEIGGYANASGDGVLSILGACPPTGACCLPNGRCENDYSQADCEAAGGIYLGDDVNCSGLDCNHNGIDDLCDLAAGTSEDCNENGIPDECDLRDCPPNTAWCDDCNENGILDICDITGFNLIHVSFRGLTIPGNRVALCDPTGTIMYEYNQIAGAYEDAWGYRDGMSDGEYVYFGWGGGLARHDADGANDVLYCAGAAPGGVGTWRALGYAPTTDTFWVCTFSTDLIEVDRHCNLVTAWPNLDGWSMYGLAWDNNTGMLWSHDANCMVQEIEPATGRWTGVNCNAQFIAGGIQGGLSTGDDDDTLYSILQATPDSLASFDTACNLTPPVNPNPRDIQGQVNENGVLGVAVIQHLAFSRDENGNGIPDECEGVIAPGDMDCDGTVDAFDIDLFVLALTDPDAYNAMYPDCNIMNGDLDCDGDLDAFDIDPFVFCLTTGVCECP